MTEAEYVRTSNPVRTRTCIDLVRNIMPGPEVHPDERRDPMRILARWDIRPETVLVTDGSDPHPVAS